MKTVQSEFKKGEVYIGRKFTHEERKWQVLQCNHDSFNAKTVDNDNKDKRQISAKFLYKK